VVFSDLDRPGLRVASLRRALIGPGSLWTDVQVVQRTGSTNADLAAAASRGVPSGTVLVAEQQTGGRGRLDRRWVAPARSGLTFSVLLRPRRVPAARWGWFPLLAGWAVQEPLARLGEIDVALKWPNDILVGTRKLAGLLAERVDGALVLGIGLNVSLQESELPVPTATSLVLEESAIIDRDPLLRAMLRSLAARYTAFEDGGGDVAALRADYLAACATVGRPVRVALPGGLMLEGEAVDIDDDGRLVVAAHDGHHAVSAGDVVHVR
jgi:BirA family biotin operon repressor/biotin-[acetyl-CoA-carboxylase] ligase